MSRPEELLTVKEVAAVLRTNADYVHALRRSGKLRFVKIGHYKCLRSTLDEFLRAMEGYDVTDPERVVPLRDSDI